MRMIVQSCVVLPSFFLSFTTAGAGEPPAESFSRDRNFAKPQLAGKEWAAPLDTVQCAQSALCPHIHTSSLCCLKGCKRAECASWMPSLRRACSDSQSKEALTICSLRNFLPWITRTRPPRMHVCVCVRACVRACVQVPDFCDVGGITVCTLDCMEPLASSE